MSERADENKSIANDAKSIIRYTDECIHELKVLLVPSIQMD